MKDSWAVACSSICVAHCLVLPFVIGLGAAGVAGQWMASEIVHQLLLIPVVLLALMSLPSAYKKHQCHWPMILAATGIALLVAALLGPHESETVFTVIGALILVVAHLWNRHLSIAWSSMQRALADG